MNYVEKQEIQLKAKIELLREMATWPFFREHYPLIMAIKEHINKLQLELEKLYMQKD